MALIWVATIASVLGISLVSFAGLVAISLNEKQLQHAVFLLVSLAVGAMFGDAFIHILPEVFSGKEATGAASAFLLLGVFTFFLLEKFLHWRHEHVPHYDDCIRPVGYVVVVAEGLHNFIDGLLIGASYLASLRLGIAITIAILLHEIPQEIGNFGVLMHSGFTRARALSLNLLSASLATAGAVTALLIGHRVKQFPEAILPLAAGGFIYVAGSDLVPELHKERAPLKSLLQLAAISIGVGLMLLLKLFD